MSEENLQQNVSTIAGYDDIRGSDMVLVFTRMRFKHWWQTILAFLKFRRVKRSMSHLSTRPHRAASALESPWIFNSISIWESPQDIHFLGNVPDHLESAKWAIRNTEIFSQNCLILYLQHRRGEDFSARSSRPLEVSRRGLHPLDRLLTNRREKRHVTRMDGVCLRSPKGARYFARRVKQCHTHGRVA